MKKKIDRNYSGCRGDTGPAVWVEECDQMGLYRLACSVDHIEHVHRHMVSDFAAIEALWKITARLGTIDPVEWYPRKASWRTVYVD